MGDTLVAVEGLIFDYGDKRALDQVTMTIERGTITALVGPNGAGKTTLLRCLAALDTPLEGSIVIGGQDVIVAPRSAHRRIGFLQDFFGVYDGLSVARNLRHGAAIQGLPVGAIERAATEAAAAVGLSDRLAQPAGDLSRGLRQRLAIARAIVHRPDLLLLDEPASGLDPEARRNLSTLLIALNRDGMTIIVSSHILAELEDYATQMLTLREGRSSGPVSVAAGTSGVRRYYVSVIGDLEPARRLLEARAEVSALREENGSLYFDLAGDEAHRSALLKDLLAAGAQVTALAAATSELEDMYMRGTKS